MSFTMTGALLPPVWVADFPTDADLRGLLWTCCSMRGLGHSKLGMLLNSEVAMNGPCRNRHPARRSARIALQYRSRQNRRRPRESGNRASARPFIVFHSRAAVFARCAMAAITSSARGCSTPRSSDRRICGLSVGAMILLRTTQISTDLDMCTTAMCAFVNVYATLAPEDVNNARGPWPVASGRENRAASRS
jgi:hypothetical protein